MVDSTTNGQGPALLRMLRTFLPRRTSERRGAWWYIVPLVLFAAGMLLATTAKTAQGTQLRNDRRVEVSELITQRRVEVDRATREASRLQRQVDDGTRVQGSSDARISEQQRRIDAMRAGAGLTAVRGPGLTVRLDDAPRRPDGSLPAGATMDDVVVHQQDVQAVVNALWAGGAEAMTIMGVRVISTSAVRCVGNTLLLHGRVYSPPFTVAAIGDRAGMLAALDRSAGVRAFVQAEHDFGLGYEVTIEEDFRVPGYDGSAALADARVPE